MKELDKKLVDTINRYKDSGIEQQVDYEKFYLYSLITHSTAIEGSTSVTVEPSIAVEPSIPIPRLLKVPRLQRWRINCCSMKVSRQKGEV